MLKIGFAICFLALFFAVCAGDFAAPQAPENDANIVFAATPKNSPEQKRTGLPPMKNPRLVLKKSERKLELFDGENLIKTYKTALGFAPRGDKEIEGDGKTPEGEFYIFTKNEKSNFYLSLGISYPSIEDAERGLHEKIITRAEHDEIVRAINEKRMPPQKTRLGGEIYIHGGGTAKDWTWGCAALADADIKELFDAIPIGAKINIES